MSQARLADALARLENHKTLRLPLAKRDLVGRLALRFLWRRLVKWQLEVNLAAGDALDALRELTDAQQAGFAQLAARLDQLPSGDSLRNEFNELRLSGQNMTAGLNQRLYSAVGGLRTELSDLRLRLADKTELADETETRLAAIEHGIAEFADTARDTRLRHAQVDLFLDRARTEPLDTPTPVPDRAAFLELAVSELLDGPTERARVTRAAYLPIVLEANENGATGPVFDAAPGRGEWLEVLRGADIRTHSASANPVIVRHCAELGYQLEPVDALSALEATAKGSLGAVSAFRYVERLSPASVARFVDLAARALQPGGALIIETSTSDSATAGDFHLDPFAQRPVHPTFLRFLAEAAGFASTEIRYPGDGAPADWPTDRPARRTDRYCLLARR